MSLLSVQSWCFLHVFYVFLWAFYVLCMNIFLEANKDHYHKYIKSRQTGILQALLHLRDDKCTGCIMTAECMESNSECMRGDMQFRVIYPAPVSYQSNA